MTPFSTAGMYWRGMAPPTTCVVELEALAPTERLELQVDDAELPVAAGLLLVPAFGFGRLRDGLPVGDRTSSTLDLDAELARQALEDDRQVGLAEPARTVWWVSSSCRTTSAGSSSRSRCRADMSLSSSPSTAGGRRPGARAAGSRAAGTRPGVPLGASVSPVCGRPSLGTATKSPATTSCHRRASCARGCARARAGAPRPGCGGCTARRRA